MEVYDQRLPVGSGRLTITLTEMEIRHILADLVSESKEHRTGTKEFEALAKNFLKRCQESIEKNE